MRFGIWDHFERQPGVAVPAQYQAKLELLQAAEGLGFVGYHLAEHHLSSLDLAPSPSVFLAALAAVTRTLRLGAMVYILPLYQPTRLVQELAMLDNLSAGRLDLGIGRGIRAAEHEWFGLDATDARAHHDEMLAFLVQAFTTGELEFAGRFVRLPAARLDLLPVQRPYPPLWYAGGVEYAARHRLNVLARTADDVAHYWALRDATDASADADGISTSAAPLNPQIAQPVAGITRHVVVRRTAAEAIAVARRAWPVFQHNWQATPLRLPDGRVARGDDSFDTVLAEGTRLLVGTPETMVEYLRAAAARLVGRPPLYVAPAFQWGDLTAAESLESMTLFATEVMPAFPDPAPAGVAG
jgi:alkanesulfonate monooxygenase SsuD/methylene tetrahydromethanopterin reductase-like flavin-dependent oxidoreductase (luciferase family)